jgi:polysaccharide chain length determinant protein (PEP-CTERM system associated)
LDLRKRISPELVIERMRSEIRLELKGVEQRGRGGATIAFAISYLGSDPQTVSLVTNTLASFYIEGNLKVRERQATGTAEFLKVQLEETKKRLDEQERRVSEFKRRHIGGLPQQLEANLATLERLNAQLRLNSDTQTRAMERRDALTKRLSEADSLSAMGGSESATARLARLKQDLTQLRTLFTEKYPDVIRVKAEIAALERQLAEAKSDGSPDPEPSATADPAILRLRQVLSELEAEMKVLKGEEKNLRAAISTYQQRVENSPQREQEFQELSRDYETTKELYRSLLKRYEEAQIAESMEQRQKGEQFRILDPALPSREPAAPRHFQLTLMALMLSLALAGGVVVMAEQLDTSFHSVDDLRTFTTVPVLASIPRIVTEADSSRRRWRVRLAAGLVVLGLALIVGASYFIARGNEQLVWILARGIS